MNFTENVTTLLDFLEAFYNPTFDTIRNREYEIYLNFLDSCFKEDELLRKATKERLKDLGAYPTYSTEFSQFLLDYLEPVDAARDCSTAIDYVSSQIQAGHAYYAPNRVARINTIFSALKYLTPSTLTQFPEESQRELFSFLESTLYLFRVMGQNMRRLDEFWGDCRKALEMNTRA